MQNKRFRDPETADSVLVQQALSGDQEAFEALMSRYKKSLAGLIYHYIGEYHEVEDILQQVWLQLYLSLPSLRPNVQIKPWLFTVARNRALDFLRHKHVRSRHLLLFCELETTVEEDEATFPDTIPDSSSTPEEQVELHDLQHQIQLAIQSLPQIYRPVVWHTYTGQFTYTQIGQMLGISGSSVKTRFNRAKPFLRVAMVAP